MAMCSDQSLVVLVDTLVGDGGDTLCGDGSGCLMLIDGVVSVVVGESK